MPSSTSRWISRSCSKASASIVTLTVPSIEFSMPTNPRSMSPLSAAARTSAMVAIGTSSSAARSASPRRACSVNVPSGPRKPMRRRAVGAASSVTRRNATGVDEAALVRLMESVRSGDVHPDDAVAELRRLPFADLGFARVDHHRALRQGLPEAVYGPGQGARARGGHRGGAARRRRLARAAHARHRGAGGRRPRSQPRWGAARDHGRVAAVRASLRAGGDRGRRHGRPAGGRRSRHRAVRVRHRAHPADRRRRGRRPPPARARPTSSPAPTPSWWWPGWKGALPSLVGGLTPAPVVAVPTSVGYGASLEGVTALLGMLASCAAGLTVVGIDNGYGAACAVLRMLK